MKAIGTMVSTPTGQVWKSEKRTLPPEFGYPSSARVTAEVRYDDQCRNGHRTLSITGEVRLPGAKDCESCGRIVEEIAAAFPELLPLLPYHLVSEAGPMHYLATTLYLAGDRDYNGLRKGETKVRRNPSGHTIYELEFFDPATKEKVKAPQCVETGEVPPEAPGLRYVPSLRVGEGKERELDAARRVAVWPDASDEELCSPPEVLRELLNARLPALMAAFRKELVDFGFQV